MTAFDVWLRQQASVPVPRAPTVVAQPAALRHAGGAVLPMTAAELDALAPRNAPTTEPGDVRITAPGGVTNHDADCICVYCQPPSIQRVLCRSHGQVGAAHNDPAFAERLAWDHIRQAHSGRGGVSDETSERPS